MTNLDEQPRRRPPAGPRSGPVLVRPRVIFWPSFWRPTPHPLAAIALFVAFTGCTGADESVAGADGVAADALVDAVVDAMTDVNSDSAADADAESRDLHPEDDGGDGEVPDAALPGDLPDMGPDGGDSGLDSAEVAGGPQHVLLFTRTEGYRHQSIEVGVQVLKELAGELGLAVTHTEEVDLFTDAGLAQFDVVVFLSTTGDVLDGSHQAALEAWMSAGGGWLGIHAAADCEYGWPWYEGLVGAWFKQHPSIQTATLQIPATGHPATAHLGDTWTRTDEWYDFHSDPSDDVTVLAWLDESTYDGGIMGESHPIAWHHENSGGRSFYTAGGHTSESYAEPDFRTHLRGALQWAAGMP